MIQGVLQADEFHRNSAASYFSPASQNNSFTA